MRHEHDTLRRSALVVALLWAVVSATAATPDQSVPPDNTSQPIGGAQPISTAHIKRCPDGYELVIRTGGRYGCAKDIVPPNDLRDHMTTPLQAPALRQRIVELLEAALQITEETGDATTAYLIERALDQAQAEAWPQALDDAPAPH